MTRRRALVAAALLAIAPAARAQYGTPPESRPPQGRPPILQDVGYDQRIGESLPLDLPFRDEDGRTVRLGDYFGTRPVLLVPAYYECPMLCTLVLNGVVSALRALSFDAGKQFEVVVFSINPRETSELAKAKKATYLGEYRRPGAEAGWHFLTGDEASIAALTKAIGFRYAWDAQQQQYAHAAGVIVVTPHGRLSRYFYGVEFPSRDLRLAFVEASNEQIGSLVDQLLLFCFHYDPATGRYSKVALDAVRAGGLVTVLGLATFLVVMLRRERSRGRVAGEARGSTA
jgi:protein SCO1/2